MADDTPRPLKPAHYLILLSLAGGDQHGYALKKSIAARTEGAVRLGAGSLYRSLSQLADAGLIEPVADRPDPQLDDQRRTYFRLTREGRHAAAAETERLSRLLAGARAEGFGA